MSRGNIQSAATNPPRWNIALLAGGDSDERSISLRSGQAVSQALQERGHFILPIDPAIVSLKGMDWNGFDAVFIALHGRFGEDGGVQTLLEESGIPYTGSSSQASRLAFDKRIAKQNFDRMQVPTPAWCELSPDESYDSLLMKAKELGWPVVIKPASQGSSLGVSIVRQPEQLQSAYERARHYDEALIMEAAIVGSEWTVGLHDDEILPPICIETDREFFDWVAKYEDDHTRYIFDKPLPATCRQKLETACRGAVHALGVTGISRVDLMLDSAGNPWVLEINTIPGLTDHSLVPKAAQQAGWTLGELCEDSIHRAIQRRPRRPHLLRRASFSTQARQSPH